MSHLPNSSENTWGTTPQPASPISSRRSHRWAKILIAVIALVVLVTAAAEFGVRAYLKGQVANKMTTSAEEKGLALPGDPTVTFGASPILLGMIQGEIPALTMDLPSSMTVSYQDSDRSRPIVDGHPAATIDVKNMEISGDNPKAGSLSVKTTLPPEYLLAVINKSQSSTPAAGQGATNDLLAGLLHVTGVTPNPEAGTLDIELSGGLATLSMTPRTVDGSLAFDVADVKILGMSLPENLVNDVSQSLTQSVEKTENLSISAAEVTADGLKVQLQGNNVRIDDIAAEVDSTTSVTVGAAPRGAAA